MISFMDRAFFSAHCAKKDVFYLKPAAAIISARRAGTTATLDQMNKYFLHAQMPVVPLNIGIGFMVQNQKKLFKMKEYYKSCVF